MRFFTEAQARLAGALVDCIFPDAAEIGVVEYLDRQLAGEWGSGARMYRATPYEMPDHPGHGWQWPGTPAEVWSDGLARIGNGFLALSPEARAEAVAELEATDPHFFALLRQGVIEGLFSDPVYGGNRDLAGWRWLGYQGRPLP